MRSVSQSALLPSSLTILPLTETWPWVINSSALRREAYPACEISFCSRSCTPLSLPRRAGHGTETRGLRQYINADRRGAFAGEVQGARGAVAKVNDARDGDRTAVVDLQHHRQMVEQVGDAHAGAQRQVAVGGGEAIHVKRLATGGFFALEQRPVPTGNAHLVRRGRQRRRRRRHWTGHEAGAMGSHRSGYQG